MPDLIKALGKNKKVAYLTPDYTYGHTVQKSMEEFGAEGGWTKATDQVSPFGTHRLQLLSAERRQQRRRRRRQHQLRPRRGAVDQTGQAVRHPRQDDAGGALQYAVPCQGSRRRHDAGRARGDRLLVDPGGQVPARENVQRRLPGEVPYSPEWSANLAYMQIAMWADALERAKSFYPPDVIKAYEAGAKSSRPSARSISAARITSSCARSSSSAARSRRT